MMGPRIWLFVWVAIAIAWIAVPKVAFAETPVVAVITVEVTGGLDQYLSYVKRLTAISAKHDAGELQVFRATYAGPNTNTVFVTLEYPSHAALAAAQAKLDADPDWQKAFQELQKSGVRSVVSRSLLENITPK